MLVNKYEEHACKEVLETMRKTLREGVIRTDEVPQIDVVSKHMYEQTGWRIRPVKGLVKPRDFLEGMAFKVFCSTIYIRNDGELMFTPAPDMIHEVFGHVLPLMTPEVAEIS